MKINIKPSMVIFVLGFLGLVFSLVDNSGEIGSKVPISLFFILIICAGIALEMYSKREGDEVFGDMDGNREIG